LQLLIDQEKDARFAHELSTIICNVEMDTVVPSYEFTTVHLKKVLELFHQLEFQSLVTKLPKNYLGSEAPAQVPGVDDEIQPVEQSVDIGNQNYILIDSNKAIDDLVAKLKKSKTLILDTETTGLHPMDARLVGISVSIKAGEAYYIPTRFVTDELKAIIADEKIDEETTFSPMSSKEPRIGLVKEFAIFVTILIVLSPLLSFYQYSMVGQR
jgi:hypothetical protein